MNDHQNGVEACGFEAGGHQHRRIETGGCFLFKDTVGCPDLLTHALERGRGIGVVQFQFSQGVVDSLSHRQPVSGVGSLVSTGRRVPVFGPLLEEASDAFHHRCQGRVMGQHERADRVEVVRTMHPLVVGQEGDRFPAVAHGLATHEHLHQKVRWQLFIQTGQLDEVREHPNRPESLRLTDLQRRDLQLIDVYQRFLGLNRDPQHHVSPGGINRLVRDLHRADDGPV